MIKVNAAKNWMCAAAFAAAMVLLLLAGPANARTEVQIISPSDGATVSGTVDVTVRQDGGIRTLEVYVDNDLLGTDPSGAISWNTKSVSDGRHTILAKGYRGNGELEDTDSVTVTVSNGSSNPAQIISPPSGSTASGEVAITVKKSAPVSWINLYIDGEYLKSTPPYTLSWNSATVPNGTHVASIAGKDSSGTVVGTDSISLNVQNGTGSTPTPTPTAVPSATPTPSPNLSFSNVFIVVEENHSYSEVVGNSSMPYINSLIDQYGVATQYYANTHPSLPNYLWLTTGSSAGINSNVCGVTVTADNVARELNAAGLSWKSYQEGLPSVGYLGCSSGDYVQRHNPFAYFSDVINSSSQRRNIVPFRQFAIDMANGALPKYSFIVPDLSNDAHNGSLAQADAWLKSNIAPLLNTSMFRPGGSGLLIITFDEGTDSSNGGGKVAWVVVSPKAKQGYRSTNFYQHQSTLRLMLEGLGVTRLPGAAAGAPDMGEFFN